MQLIGRIRLSFWLCALGAVVLYTFFAAIAAVSPLEVGPVTVVMAVLVAMLMLRSLRVTSELADPGGDPFLRRALNHQRERRGF